MQTEKLHKNLFSKLYAMFTGKKIVSRLKDCASLKRLIALFF